MVIVALLEEIRVVERVYALQIGCKKNVFISPKIPRPNFFLKNILNAIIRANKAIVSIKAKPKTT